MPVNSQRTFTAFRLLVNGVHFDVRPAAISDFRVFGGKPETKSRARTPSPSSLSQSVVTYTISSKVFSNTMTGHRGVNFREDQLERAMTLSRICHEFSGTPASTALSVHLIIRGSSLHVGFMCFPRRCHILVGARFFEVASLAVRSEAGVLIACQHRISCDPSSSNQTSLLLFRFIFRRRAARRHRRPSDEISADNLIPSISVII